MQITDTIKNIDLPAIDFGSVNERFEQVSKTAVDTYSDTSGRVIDVVVDTNKKVVDMVVTNASKVTDAVEPRLVDTPLADRLPAPAEVGKAYLDIVERVADFNRDVNRRVADMVPAAAPAKPAAKRKASAKRAAA